MNSVIAYKKFSLGEGLADLFASEVKNFEAFKASVIAQSKKFRQTFGRTDWEKVCHDNTKTDSGGGTSHENGCTSTTSLI